LPPAAMLAMAAARRVNRSGWNEMANALDAPAPGSIGATELTEDEGLTAIELLAELPPAADAARASASGVGGGSALPPPPTRVPCSEALAATADSTYT
jgi:hypothetical protein